MTSVGAETAARVRERGAYVWALERRPQATFTFKRRRGPIESDAAGFTRARDVKTGGSGSGTPSMNGACRSGNSSLVGVGSCGVVPLFCAPR